MSRFQITPLPEGRFLLIDPNVPRVASRIVNGHTCLYAARFAFETTRGTCNCTDFLKHRTTCEHIQAVRAHTDNIHAAATKINTTQV